MGSSSGATVIRALIIGVSSLATDLIEKLGRHSGYEVVGVVAERADNDQLGRGLPILGALADLDRIVRRARPDLIVVAQTDRRGLLPIRQLLDSQIRGRVSVEDGSAFFERLTGALELATLTPASVLFSQVFQPSRWRLQSTRVLGVVLALVALVAALPLCVLIALAIKLDSRGPVFFVQERLGVFGKPFRLVKFRTMIPAEGETSEWVRDNNQRITRVGDLLRKFRLDELPQLVNIVKGDMNLVGPRPHPVRNGEILTMLARNLCDLSGIDIPYYTLRCLVRPGITGWAQVRYGYANDFAEELEKIKYDLYYIKHVSLGLDLSILLETIRVVVRGRASSLLGSSARAGRCRPVLPWALSRKIVDSRSA